MIEKIIEILMILCLTLCSFGALVCTVAIGIVIYGLIQ